MRIERQDQRRINELLYGEDFGLIYKPNFREDILDEVILSMLEILESMDERLRYLEDIHKGRIDHGL